MLWFAYILVLKKICVPLLFKSLFSEGFQVSFYASFKRNKQSLAPLYKDLLWIFFYEYLTYDLYYFWVLDLPSSFFPTVFPPCWQAQTQNVLSNTWECSKNFQILFHKLSSRTFVLVGRNWLLHASSLFSPRIFFNKKLARENTD